MASKPNNINEMQAIQWWNQGIKPSFSSNIADQITCGYGRLYNWGEWEYPLEPGIEYLNKSMRN